MILVFATDIEGEIVLHKLNVFTMQIFHISKPPQSLHVSLSQNDKDVLRNHIIKKTFILFNCLLSSARFLPGSAFTLVLGLIRDTPPRCALGGRKRGLRRKLWRSFSFWSVSHPSARSVALGSSFHLGLGLVRFGLEGYCVGFIC